MSHFAHQILRRSMLLLSLLLAASCSLIYDEAPDVEESNDCYVTLTIRTSAPGTRAENPAGYDDGTDVAYENYIDIDGGDYHFYLFRADDTDPANETFITEVRPETGPFLTEVRPEGSPLVVPSAGSSNTYHIIGKVDPTLFEDVTAYKAVFVCNWGKKGGAPNYPPLTPGTSTIADVQATYDYTSAWTLGPNGPTTPNCHLIPMFGVSNTISVTTHPIEAGLRTDVGTLHLLRAMAKIEVMVSDQETDDIESIQLVGFNTTGYCAPVGVNKQSDYFGSDYVYANDFRHTPSLVNSGKNNEDADQNTRAVPYTEATATSPRIFTVYVPEYCNEATGRTLAADAACLKITFKGGDTEEYRLDFTAMRDKVPYDDYNKDDAFNLLRNSYYRYVVKRTDKRKLEVEVHPYFTADLRPDFGIETGTIIWEGMWSVTAAIVGQNAMNDLKQPLYDWGQVTPGQTLMIYMLSREQEGVGATEYNKQFCVKLQRYETSSSESKQITGLQAEYYRPANGVLHIPLTQATLDDIIAHNGISITGQYFILYRVTIR